MYVLAFSSVCIAWWLAVRVHIPPWVPLLVPVAVAIYCYVLWRDVGGDNRGVAILSFIFVEALTLIALAAGFAYRRHRTP